MWVFILGCMLTACAGQSASPSCPVELSPPAVVVRFRDPFTVNCSSSIEIEGMGWESTYRGIGLTEGVTSLSFDIESVDDWDIESNCFINRIGGEQCAEVLPITVYKTPDSVSMSEPSPTGPMLEGRTYRIQCDVVNVAPARNLSVHWYKGKEIILTETFDESKSSPVDKSSVLNLTAHRDDNGTNIWCKAELNFQPRVPNLPLSQSKSHELIVLSPPAFINPEHETLEIPVGKKVVLNCTASGNPMPEYRWHLPHAIQKEEKLENQNQPLFTPSFQLPGTYNCTASNSLGSKTKRITLIEPPRDLTTFAALVGGIGSLGALLMVAGPFFVTPDGTFSLSKGSYLRGQPISSGPV